MMGGQVSSIGIQKDVSHTHNTHTRTHTQHTHTHTHTTHTHIHKHTHTHTHTCQNKLDLDPSVERILRNSSLSGTAAIRDCTNAAQALQDAVSRELSQGVSILQAVTDQKKLFATLSFTFGRRLHEHLSSMFASQVGNNQLLPPPPNPISQYRV